MKKVLSLIMAVIMLLSCVPMVSAYEFTELESALLDAFCKCNAAYYTVYSNDGATGQLGMHIPGGPAYYYEASDISDYVYEIFTFGGIKKFVAANPERAEEFLDAVNVVIVSV